MNIRKAALLGAAVFVVSGCTPKHSKSVGFLKWSTDPGYTWVDPKAIFLETKWNPGAAHPDYPDILAASTQDEWIPQNGYEWDGGASGEPAYSSRSSGNLNPVHWSPGIGNADNPHISADTKEGSWDAENGYQFDHTDGSSLAVHWTPGLKDLHRAHYISAQEEGKWNLEPGYQEVSGPFGTVAQWMPGLAYPSDDCMISEATEGAWKPVVNHHLESQADGHMKVVADSSGTDWGKVFVKGLFAVFAYSASTPKEEDGVVTSTIKRGMGEAGTEAAKSAISDVVSPGNDDRCANVTLSDGWKYQGSTM